MRVTAGDGPPNLRGAASHHASRAPATTPSPAPHGDPRRISGGVVVGGGQGAGKVATGGVELSVDHWASLTMVVAATAHAPQLRGSWVLRIYGSPAAGARRDASPPPCAALTEFATDLTVSCHPTPNMRRARAPSSRQGGRGRFQARGMGSPLLAGVARVGAARFRVLAQALSLGEELVAGWRLMCERTRNSCQATLPRCAAQRLRTGEPSRGTVACPPAWQFDVELRRQRGSGSAADADEDSCSGSCRWWRRPTRRRGRAGRRRSCGRTRRRARFAVQHGGGGRRAAHAARLVLGRVDCNNPSYLAPATTAPSAPLCSPRRVRQGERGERGGRQLGRAGARLVRDAARRAVRAHRADAQLVAARRPAAARRRRLQLVGTSADEFGAEASRGVWRVALDALGLRAVGGRRRRRPGILRRVGTTSCRSSTRATSPTSNPTPAAPSRRSTRAGRALSTGRCRRRDAAARDGEGDAEEGAAALAAHIGAVPRRDRADYYHGSWLAIATVTLNGDLGRVRAAARRRQLPGGGGGADGGGGRGGCEVRVRRSCLEYDYTGSDCSVRVWSTSR